MKYTDWDMKIMALNEIGADIMAVLAAVGVWIYLGNTPWLLKLLAAFLTQRLVIKSALWFVHLGYEPDEQEEPQ